MNVMLLIFLSSLFSFGNTSAADPGNEEKNAPTVKHVIKIKEQIQDKVQFPEFSSEKDNDQEVDVSFKITEDQTLKITKVNSDDVQLNQYVQSKMEQMQLSGDFSSLSPNISYKITLRFRRM